MERKDFRIIYMGTPDFAVASLASLVDAGFNVVAVVTMPDKAQGRGMKLSYSPVKEYALSKGIELLQPISLKDEDFINRLRELNPDLGVVVAFRMLPEIVWSLPKLGTINLHGSLLPKYRGAAPINWAIINGDKETGVSTFLLKHEIDTGDIIMQAKMPIGENENVGSVHDRMMLLGADSLVKTVDLLLLGDVKAQSQDSINIDPSPAPKLNKENTYINFDNSTLNIHNFVRGLSPYPSAWSELSILGKEKSVYKIYETAITPLDENLDDIKVGESFVRFKNRLFVRTVDSAIEICFLQAQGKKRMKASDFLNGLKN